MRTFSFVRPGEAAHNVLINGGSEAGGHALLDPALTAHGRAQAAALAEELREPQRQYDVVVTSPLARALETAAAIARTQDAVSVIVTPLHTENGIPLAGDTAAGAPCRRGASADDLVARYPSDWDFSALRDGRAWATDGAGWFYPAPVEARLPRFRQFLEALPLGKDILVVGHSGFFEKLLGQDQAVGNCEILTRGLDA